MSKKPWLLLLLTFFLGIPVSVILSGRISIAQATQTVASPQRSSTARPMVPGWEYRILADSSGEYGASRNYDVLQGQINHLAGQGFEVDSVEVAPGIKGGGPGGVGFSIEGRLTIVVVLKRERT